MNRKINCLSHILEEGLGGSLRFTNEYAFYHGEGGSEDIDIDLALTVAKAGRWKVPLDQSSFDQNQSYLFKVH